MVVASDSTLRKNRNRDIPQLATQTFRSFQMSRIDPLFAQTPTAVKPHPPNPQTSIPCMYVLLPLDAARLPATPNTICFPGAVKPMPLTTSQRPARTPARPLSRPHQHLTRSAHKFLLCDIVRSSIETERLPSVQPRNRGG